eukprot:2829025-Pyramimonas_sp.AAC.1
MACVRLVHVDAFTEYTRAHPASDWSVTRIYPHGLRPIGPSRGYIRMSCVRLVHVDTFSAGRQTRTAAPPRVCAELLRTGCPLPGTAPL